MILDVKLGHGGTRADIFTMRGTKNLGNKAIVKRKIPWDAIVRMC